MKKYKYLYFLLLMIWLFNTGLFAQEITADEKDMKIASYLQKANELEGYKDSYVFKKIENIYKKILNNDSLNIEATYNLGVLYYNKSIVLLKMAKHETNSKKKEELKNQAMEYQELYGPYKAKFDRLNNRNQD